MSAMEIISRMLKESMIREGGNIMLGKATDLSLPKMRVKVTSSEPRLSAICSERNNTQHHTFLV